MPPNTLARMERLAMLSLVVTNQNDDTLILLKELHSDVIDEVAELYGPERNSIQYARLAYARLLVSQNRKEEAATRCGKFKTLATGPMSQRFVIAHSVLEGLSLWDLGNTEAADQSARLTIALGTDSVFPTEVVVYDTYQYLLAWIRQTQFDLSNDKPSWTEIEVMLEKAASRQARQQYDLDSPDDDTLWVIAHKIDSIDQSVVHRNILCNGCYSIRTEVIQSELS